MEFDPRTTPRELVIAWVRMGLKIEFCGIDGWSISSVNYNINSELEPAYRYRVRSPWNSSSSP